MILIEPGLDQEDVDEFDEGFPRRSWIRLSTVSPTLSPIFCASVLRFATRRLTTGLLGLGSADTSHFEPHDVSHAEVQVP